MPKVICHIITGDLWAGAEVQVFNLLCSLKDCSIYDYYVICFNEGIITSQLSIKGFKVIIIDEKINNTLSIAFKIDSVLKSISCSFVHVHGYKEMFIASIIKLHRLGSLKIVRTFHGKGIFGSKKFHHLLIETINSRFLNYGVFVSNELKLSLQYYFSKNLNCSVVYNGISIITTSLCDNSSKSLLDEFNITKNAFILGTVGRLVPVKGFDILLYVISNLIKYFSNIFLIIIGDGPLRKRLEQQAVDLNIIKNVIFTGFRENSKELIMCFDIFALSSYHEGIPMVLLEAMISSIPIISTRVGGIPELLRNQIDAVLVSPNNISEYSKSCAELINDPFKRSILAKNALHRVKSMFNSTISAEKIQLIYNKIETP